MTQGTVRLHIPFESLLDAIALLEVEEKYQLVQMLESEIAQAEEDLLSEDSRVQAEIQSARLAYQKGDYQTIEEYIASRSNSKP